METFIRLLCVLSNKYIFYPFGQLLSVKGVCPSIPILLVETGGIASMYAGRGGIIVAYA